MKHIIPLLLVLLLTACGGGGGGGGGGSNQSNTASSDSVIGTISHNAGIDFSAKITTGRFDNVSGKYIVVSGIYLGPNNFGPTPNPDGPLRIYKVNSDGSGADVTSNILGASVTIPGNAIVADFNGDGIDDIVSLYLKDYPSGPGNGAPGFSGAGAIFLSRPGQVHSRTALNGTGWSHSNTVYDINGDGNLDIINSQGKMWVNDGQGNFTFRDHDWNTNTSNGLWMNGSGVCAGDFNNIGRPQLVITDVMTGVASISDTVIFELDAQLIPTTAHTLTVPVLDRATNVGSNEVSHDIACKTADLNNDGMLDIIVFSRPWDYARNGVWTEEGTVQVLINQGNWQFNDVTDSLMINSAIPIYHPTLVDFNNDGRLDLWDGSSTAYLNNGNSVFVHSIGALSRSTSMASVPLSLNSIWRFVTVESSSSSSVIRIKAPLLTFP